MMAYTKPQQRKKEESGRLGGEGDQIKFTDFRCEKWQVVGWSELCWGKAMVANAKPQQRKREDSERLGGEGSDLNDLKILLHFGCNRVCPFRFLSKYQLMIFSDSRNPDMAVRWKQRQFGITHTQVVEYGHGCCLTNNVGFNLFVLSFNTRTCRALAETYPRRDRQRRCNKFRIKSWWKI